MKFKRATCIISAFSAIVTSICVLGFFISTLNSSDNKFTELSILFIGIALLITIIGLFVVSLLMLWQLGVITSHHIEEEKTIAECKCSKDSANEMKKEAEVRFIKEKERNTVNDLFRLIELAKDQSLKTEETVNKEKPTDPVVRIINKNEGLDIKKLEHLINHYKILTKENNSNPGNYV